MTDTAIEQLAPQVGVRAACEAVGAAQAGWYRRHRQSPVPVRPAPVPHRDRVQPRALSQAEEKAILDELHCERFADLSPAETWAVLLDEGRYWARCLRSTGCCARPLARGSGASRPLTRRR